MKVLELRNLQRDDNFIYYRRTFHAIAVLQSVLKEFETPIEFTIETSPLGKKDIDVSITGQIDYPIYPVIQALKESIITKDSEGTLP